jgi:acid phosphatase family membrane protein YuiD
MPIVGLALVLFASAFLLHLIRWRIAPPAATTRALVLTFVFAILAGLALVLLMARIVPSLAAVLPSDPFAVLLSLLLSLALAAGYVMTYPAIEVESPTLVMIQAIARRGQEGLSRATLFAQLNDEVLVAPRVRDLMSDGLAVERGGRLHLSESGRRLVRLFVMWRRVLGAREGG